jgi:hypothetical protein
VSLSQYFRGLSKAVSSDELHPVSLRAEEFGSKIGSKIVSRFYKCAAASRANDSPPPATTHLVSGRRDRLQAPHEPQLNFSARLWKRVPVDRCGVFARPAGTQAQAAPRPLDFNHKSVPPSHSMTVEQHFEKLNIKTACPAARPDTDGGLFFLAIAAKSPFLSRTPQQLLLR